MNCSVLTTIMTDFYRAQVAVDEITNHILVNNQIRISRAEIEAVVYDELETYGVEKAFSGSTMLWVNYIKKDLIKKVSNRLEGWYLFWKVTELSVAEKGKKRMGASRQPDSNQLRFIARNIRKYYFRW